MNITPSRPLPDPPRDEPPSGRSSPDFERPDFSNNNCDPREAAGPDHRDLVCAYISHKLSRRPLWSDAQSELKAVTAALLRENRGEATPEAAAPAEPLFSATVAEELFADEAPSWGRVVGLVVFGSAVCGSLEEEEERGGGGLNMSAYLLLPGNRKLLPGNRKLLLDRDPWSGLEELSGEDPRPALMEAPGATGGTPLAPALRT